jgi:hypothetical protein
MATITSPDVCDGCGYQAPVTGLYNTRGARKPDGTPYRLCTLCFYSGAGVIFTRPTQDPSVDLLRAAVHCLNRLRTELYETRAEILDSLDRSRSPG